MSWGAKFRDLWQFVRVKNRELWHDNIYHIGEFSCGFLCSSINYYYICGVMLDSYQARQRYNNAMSKFTGVGACILKVAFFLFDYERNLERCKRV